MLRKSFFLPACQVARSTHKQLCAVRILDQSPIVSADLAAQNQTVKAWVDATFWARRLGPEKTDLEDYR